MAIYEYVCSGAGLRHRLDEHFPMGQAPDVIYCGQHGQYAPRAFTAPHFTEDRRRFRSGISPVTGLPFAETRAEEKQIEAALGIEFIGPGDMPRAWRESLDYKAHVDSGGERLPFGDIHAPEPVEDKPLTAYMDEAGFRVGEATHDPTPEHQEAQLRAIIEANP